MNKSYCPHCLPLKRQSHATLYLEHYFWQLHAIIFLPFKIFKLDKYINRLALAIINRAHDIAISVGLIQLDAEPDESQFLNRSLIFWREAKKRGLEIFALKTKNGYLSNFCLSHKGRRLYFEGAPPLITLPPQIENKNTAKKILAAGGIPIAPGKAFTSGRRALAYGLRLGFPLVVKPDSGSLSAHVTCPVNNQNELFQAIVIARQYQPRFVVEKFFVGGLYRASVIDRQHVFICKKELANVEGDGTSSLKVLIDEKNADSRRGDAGQRNTTLHKIPIDQTLMRMLAHQGLTLDSVISAGQKIYLQKKCILSLGCDVVSCTNDAHPQNIKLFQKISQLLKMDLVGIDFICPDISRPYFDQTCAVIEVNSLPYIDMHQCPSHGAPDAVAEIVWDSVIQKLSHRYETRN